MSLKNRLLKLESTSGREKLNIILRKPLSGQPLPEARTAGSVNVVFKYEVNK